MVERRVWKAESSARRVWHCWRREEARDALVITAGGVGEVGDWSSFSSFAVGESEDSGVAVIWER